MGKRNTIQKGIVLEAVQELKRHVTADEVYDYVSSKHSSISRGTVYRNLNILEEEGKIQKIKNPSGADIYDFTLSEHYHIKCVSCKRVFDVEMEEQPKIISNIKDKHGFLFYRYHLFFEGLCPDCKSRQEVTNIQASSI